MAVRNLQAVRVLVGEANHRALVQLHVV
jgi:hypothetical protein